MTEMSRIARAPHGRAGISITRQVSAVSPPGPSSVFRASVQVANKTNRLCSPGVRAEVCGLVLQCSSQNAVESLPAGPALRGILHLQLDECGGVEDAAAPAVLRTHPALTWH